MDEKKFALPYPDDDSLQNRPFQQNQMFDLPPTYDEALEGVSILPSAPNAPTTLSSTPVGPTTLIAPSAPMDETIWTHSSSPSMNPSVDPTCSKDPTGPMVPEVREPVAEPEISLVSVCQVYLVLICQLILMALIVSMFANHSISRWFNDFNGFIFFLTLAIFLILLFLLGFCKSVQKSFPINLIALLIFTVSLSLMIGSLVSDLGGDLIFYGIKICAGFLPILLIINVFSVCLRRVTYTWYFSILLIVLVALVVIFSSPENERLWITYFMLGAQAYALYLACFLHVTLGLPLREKYYYRRCHCRSHYCTHYGYYPAGHMGVGGIHQHNGITQMEEGAVVDGSVGEHERGDDNGGGNFGDDDIEGGNDGGNDDGGDDNGGDDFGGGDDYGGGDDGGDCGGGGSDD